MSDDLDSPLGRRRRRAAPGRGPRSWPWLRMGLALSLVIGVGIAAWVALVDDPDGGRPVAEVAVSTGAAPNPLAQDVASDPDLSEAEPIDLPPPTGPGGPSIITLGDTPPAASGADDAPGAMADLVEMTAEGPLPRRSASGLTPFEAYARPSIGPDSAAGRGLVAVVVTGLGINPERTGEAIDTLPGAITLSFAPYGSALQSLAARARAAGHEIMLEVPLEPFDYPQNDPGPHTLLADQPPRENLDRLHWLMGRFEGYTGLINHMGARFTAAAADFGPVMEELGLRGLSWLDDGTSNRSVARQLAGQNEVPFARVDLVLDANPSRDAILAALRDLETRARAQGQAIGSVSALPVSIQTIAQWAAAIDDTDVVLVPVSALSGTSRETSMNPALSPEMEAQP
ncbi:divergent polysaccharide deacetylase family protein [Pelagibacterium montanilacus]|uniref:divergent polysaccharide deacetylase family protein n=1 Tax=Pelagibacterium montanilacus TaxID=2185280 RepID=UPI000F8E1849|nr:divergent polysaccharide deacetylase family protein [Pelagibacterium montanilacus]